MIRHLFSLACALAIFTAVPASAQNTLNIQLKSGVVKIEMLPDLAPNHVERIKTLASQGAYDGVAFHRVIDGFMAQAGDVQHGKVQTDGSVSRRVGSGGSSLPDLAQEFSATPVTRGTVAMARTPDPDSANSQFFIMFEDASFMNDLPSSVREQVLADPDLLDEAAANPNRNQFIRNFYTVWGRVSSGMELVDNIKKGSRANNGSVSEPDQMIRVWVE
ncbi:MAG: peptidylprolyl isomerase [Pseudomonadota bacterium]